MAQPTCVILDFGNVVAYFDHARACGRLAKMSRSRLEASVVASEIFDTGLEQKYDRGEISSLDFVEELRNRLDLDATDWQIEEAWSDIFTRNSQIYPTIFAIKQCGARLVLASNTNELHFRKLSAQFSDILTCFDQLVLSFRLGFRKPQVEFFEACRAACAPGMVGCLFVDDRLDFVAAAQTHGMTAVHYTGGPAPELIGLLKSVGGDRG
jgi:glucose-1-phosphatase